MSRKKKDKKSDTINNQKKTYKGILEVTRSGMAFVIVEGLTNDIMVKQKNLQTALDKDEVLVEVFKQSRNGSRMEGVVTDILKRHKIEFTGTLQVSKSFAFLVPEKGLFMPDIYIPANAVGMAKSGDKAVVKIVAWGEKSRKPVGEIVEILDASDTNDLAMKEILIEAGFPLSFPKEVMEELNIIQHHITETDIRKRKDIRTIFTITIDPVDAKDFDDAISVRKLKNGLYEVGVHIADVSHYVSSGTELDKEAHKRATSVYLPDRVLPMLPEKISNELCSLRPHEDKLTFSAIFQMNEQGKVIQHWIGRTVIHSNHRFTYEEVQEIIENKEGPYQEEILLLNNLAQILRAQRFTNGAINFSSQEVRFKLDATGKPVGIVIKESKEAHQLIEELMLLANKTIAAYVTKVKINKQQVPFPYRVHDTPDPEKLKVFALFANKFGYKFDLSTPENIAVSFNKMLLKVKGKPEQPVLETLGIRTMAKAVYTVNNIGHYGLGFEDYCHFTSPIRRYPDVLVHRVLEECLNNTVKPDKQMEQKCKHSSEMERKAMEAERAGNKYKQVEYMQQFIGHTFEGVISGVAHFGFWVETIDTKCEGLISIHHLNKREEFQFNEGEYALVGKASGRIFRIGEKVSIRVVGANLAKRQLDYDLEDELTTTGAYRLAHRDTRKDQLRDSRRKKKERAHREAVEQWGPEKLSQEATVAQVSIREPEPQPVVDQVVVETHMAVTPVPASGSIPSTPKKTKAGKEKALTAERSTGTKAPAKRKTAPHKMTSPGNIEVTLPDTDQIKKAVTSESIKKSVTTSPAGKRANSKKPAGISGAVKKKSVEAAAPQKAKPVNEPVKKVKKTSNKTVAAKAPSNREVTKTAPIKRKSIKNADSNPALAKKAATNKTLKAPAPDAEKAIVKKVAKKPVTGVQNKKVVMPKKAAAGKSSTKKKK